MKRLLTGLWLIGCMLVAPLALGEAYFRYGEPVLFPDRAKAHLAPAALRVRSLQYQPTVYARHVFPAMTQEVEAWGGGRITVNSKGYRGGEFSIRKPPGSVRIMVFGGSAAFDLGAADGRDWPHLVETRLRQRGFDHVEVLNAGIPGHASTDVIARLMTEGHLLGPDYVLIYNGWNDIKYFTEPQPLLRQMEPLSLNPMLYYQGALDRFLSETFETYVRLRQAFWKRRLNLGSEGAIIHGQEISRTLAFGDVLPAPAASEYGIHETGLRQFEMNIRNFIDVVHNLGATPILVSQATLVHSGNSEAEKRKIKYEYVRLDHPGLVHAYGTVKEILVRVAEDKRVELIDAESAVPKNLDHFYDHVHLKPAGSDQVATAVTRSLRAMLAEHGAALR